jgi:hypothetical protein
MVDESHPAGDAGYSKQTGSNVKLPVPSMLARTK